MQTFSRKPIALAALLTVLVWVCPQPAWAQATSAEQPAKVDEVQTIIITTARRRGESIQEVPVSVTAINAAALERQQVQDLEGLNLSVPNVTIVRNTGTNVGAQIYIRGVGNDDSAFNIEPAVGIYLDDVYIGRQVGAMLDLLDFERVEFLRGPQGTLYGRNSSAGAIKYVSRRPDLINASVSGAVTIGQRGRQALRLSGNLPIVSDSLALKFDLAKRKEDGWMKVVNATGADTGQRANARDSKAARLSGLWALDNKTDVLFSLDGSTNTSGPQVLASTNCSGRIGAGVAPTAPNSSFNVVCPFRFDARSSGQGAPDINKFRGQGGNVTVTRDLVGMEFKSVTAHRSFTDELALDLSGNPAAPFLLVQYLKQKQFSQEFQLSSRGKGPLNWIVGAFYFDETIDQNALFSGVRNIDTQKAKSYALFGEAYWRFADAWTLTVGLRGSKDEKDIDRKFFPSATATTPTATLAMGQSPYSENKTTPKLGIDFKASRDVMLYASYGEGYRAGGYAAARPTSVNQVGGKLVAETVKAYEVGIKSEWLDRRLRLNAAAFTASYKNLQSSVLGADGSFSVITGDAHFDGIELEAALRATKDWNVYFLGGLLRDKWDRPPANLPTAIRLKHAPRSQYKVGTDYAISGVGPGQIKLVANYRWTDEIYRSTANHQNIKSPAYGVVDALVSYAWDRDKYKITLGGTNLADKVYWTQGVSTLGRYIGQPRSIAVTLDAKF